jgi:hypothetical protein
VNLDEIFIFVRRKKFKNKSKSKSLGHFIDLNSAIWHVISGSVMKLIKLLRNVSLSIALLFASSYIAYAQYAAGSTPTYQSWTLTGRIGTNPSITTSSAAIQLPAGGVAGTSGNPGLTARICNTAATAADVYLVFGTSNAVVATQATGSWVKVGTCSNFSLRPFPPTTSQFTWFAAICVGASCPAAIYVETGLGAYVPGQ